MILILQPEARRRDIDFKVQGVNVSYMQSVYCRCFCCYTSWIYNKVHLHAILLEEHLGYAICLPKADKDFLRNAVLVILSRI